MNSGSCKKVKKFRREKAAALLESVLHLRYTEASVCQAHFGAVAGWLCSVLSLSALVLVPGAGLQTSQILGFAFLEPRPFAGSN